MTDAPPADVPSAGPPSASAAVPSAAPAAPSAPAADRPRYQPLVETAFGQLDLDQGLAALAMLALGLRQFLSNGVTSGYALAFLLTPVWIGCVRRYRGASLVLLVGAAAAVGGYLQSGRSAVTNVVDGSAERSALVLMLGTMAGVGAVLWARQVLSTSLAAGFFGAGMLVGAGAGLADVGDNPWKFAWAVPVALVLLSAVARPRRSALEVGALLLLALASIVFDSRSYFATFLLSALLVVWQMRPVALSRRGSWAWTALLMGSIAAAVYYLGTTLLVGGYLGQAAQARSIQQIDTSGSLILGGRPELAATWSLFQHRVGGFGAGVVANPNDVLVAKAGMKSLGYDPNNGYVERFMFGSSKIELHSTVGDLWATYGLVGLAFAALVVVIVIQGLAEAVARRAAGGTLIFLACWTLWNTLFSPLYASVPTLMLTLGVILPLRSARRSAAPAADTARPSRKLFVSKAVT